MNDTLTPKPEMEEEDGGGLNLAMVRGWLSFTWLAMGRHRRLVLGSVLIVLALTAGLLSVMTKTYYVFTSILAQRNQVIATLGNPGRQGFGEADVPTRAAADAILRRDNLVALVKQTHLDKTWPETRSPIGRAMDVVRTTLHGPLSPEDQIEALATLLERRLYVLTSDNKIVIGINWPDPQAAFRIVSAAEQNFVESRHVTEISLIAESISILESHAAQARDAVAKALQDVRSRPGGRTVAVDDAPMPAAGKPEDEELKRLGILLTAKRRAVRDLEDFRRRRLSELQAQLAEQKAIYAGSHPNVIAIEESIKGLDQDSPQLLALQREEQEIEEEYRRRNGPEIPDSEPMTTTVRLAPLAALAGERTGGKKDAEDDYARQRLSAAVSRYATLVDRINSARVEMDAARAAFKYRYIIVRPPKQPEGPIKPSARLYLAGGLAVGLLFGILAAVVVELRRGFVVQSWQVESLLGVPVLGEIRRADASH